jgi:hypothetical protein
MHLRLHLPLAYLSYKLGLFFSFFHYEFDLLKRIHETIVFGNTKIGYFLQCWLSSGKMTLSTQSVAPSERCHWAKLLRAFSPKNGYIHPCIEPNQLIDFKIFRLKAYHILAQWKSHEMASPWEDYVHK